MPVLTDVRNVAVDALDTLVALMRHQRTCRQCTLDEALCDTARTYQHSFMRAVRHYARLQVD